MFDVGLRGVGFSGDMSGWQSVCERVRIGFGVGEVICFRLAMSKDGVR